MTRTSTVLTSVLSDALIAGLDPAIHLFGFGSS
jgi:hypothetical protein